LLGGGSNYLLEDKKHSLQIKKGLNSETQQEIRVTMQTVETINGINLHMARALGVS